MYIEADFPLKSIFSNRMTETELLLDALIYKLISDNQNYAGHGDLSVYTGDR